MSTWTYTRKILVKTIIHNVDLGLKYNCIRFWRGETHNHMELIDIIKGIKYHKKQI